MTKMTKTMQSVPKKSSGIGLVLHEKGSGPVDLAVKVGPQVHCGGGERERERERDDVDDDDDDEGAKTVLASEHPP